MAERIPRASISVRFFGDEDTMAMFARGPIGERAVLMFIQLLTLAKELKNGGTFNHPIEVYAVRLFTTPQVARECFSILSEPSFAWLVERDGGFVVRSYDKYNDAPVAGWGGKRPGSGRPNKAKNHLDNHLENQVEIKKNQDGYTSVSVSSSVNQSSLEVHFDSLIAHVSRAVETVMGRAMSPASGDEARVSGMVRGWINKHGVLVKINGRDEPIEILITRAANMATPDKVSSRKAPGILAWIEAVIENCLRERTWPGEKKEKPKPGEGRTLSAAEVEKALARADGVARSW